LRVVCQSVQGMATHQHRPRSSRYQEVSIDEKRVGPQRRRRPRQSNRSTWQATKTANSLCHSGGYEYYRRGSWWGMEIWEEGREGGWGLWRRSEGMCDVGRFFLSLTWTTKAGANCSGGQPGRVTLDQIKTRRRQADWQVETTAKVSVQTSLRVQRRGCCGD